LKWDVGNQRLKKAASLSVEKIFKRGVAPGIEKLKTDVMDRNHRIQDSG
jgi:hypothetical protein